MEKMIINDSIPLSTYENGLEIKKPISDSDFFKNQNSNFVKIKDNKNSDKKKKCKKDFYAIITTSGKEINNRIYDDISIKNNVLNKDWTNPSKKPILKNHDLYFGEPVGRITDTFFISHSNLSIQSSSENKVPNEVIKYYTDLGLFSKGISSSIAKFSADEETSEKISEGLYNTVSQSSYMDKAVCNICGKDYYGNDCYHMAGRTYEITREEDNVIIQKKCIVDTSGFTPIEVSIVNLPANDSSIIAVYDVDNKTVNEFKNEDSSSSLDIKKVEEGENMKGKEGITDVSEQTNNDTKQNEKSSLKGLVKDMCLDKLKLSFDMNEEKTKAVDNLFNTLATDEQISSFKEFINIFSDIKKEEPKICDNEIIKDNIEDGENDGNKIQDKIDPKEGNSSKQTIDTGITDSKIEKDLEEVHGIEKKEEEKIEDLELKALLQRFK